MKTRTAPDTPKFRLSRRIFLRGGLAAAGAAALGGVYSFRLEPKWVEFVEYMLPIKNLPQSLNGAKLVQISDMHIGGEFDWRYQLGVFQEVRELAPQFVMYTGDFVSNLHSTDTAELDSVLQHAPRGSLGSAAVLGNHDYGERWRDVRIGNAVAQSLEDVGVRVLRNNSAEFNGLQFFGFDDYWSPNYNPAFTQTIDFTRPTICLCHNPDVLDKPVWSGYDGWVLSGHTHGGQVKPPFLPPPFLPVNNRRYTQGTFSFDDGRKLYINRGLGSSRSVRFNVRPEVTVFTLSRA